MAITTITPAILSGLAVAYALEADLTASTLGQYGPKAGRAEPAEDAVGRRPALAISATGEQTSTTTVSVVTQASGRIGKAGYRWRRTVSGVADTYWRGADIPNILVGAAFPGWSAVVNQAEPHALTLPDDTQVVVYRQTNGVTRDVKAIVWSPATDSYASASTVIAGLDASHLTGCGLCLIPDPGGSTDPIILCAYWVADDVNNEAQIDIAYSRDGGTTWANWARSVLPNAIVINSGSPYYTLGRIRWTAIGSQLVMFLHLTASSGTPRDSIYQYASGDLGTSFTLIGSLPECAYMDVVTVGACAYLAYLLNPATTVVVAIIKPVPNAWTLAPLDDISTSVDFFFDLSDAGEASAGQFIYGELSITATPTGQIFGVLIRPVSTGEKIGYSAMYDPSTDTIYDHLTTWGAGGITYRHWWWDGLTTSTEYPSSLAVTAYRGQLRVYCTMISSVTTFDERVTRLDIGGPTSITMPSRNSSAFEDGGIAWKQTMLPVALASVFGATFTGAGSRSISTNTGSETLTTTANTAYYTLAPTADATQQFMVLFRVQVDSGGGVSSRVVACGLRAAGVGYGFEFELRFSTTQIRFRDVNGASDETTVDVATTAGVDVLMAISGAGVASAWYRTVGSDEDRYFLPIEVAFQLTDDAGAGGTANVIMWGNRASGTAVSRWIMLGENEGASLGSADLAGGLTLPDDLRAVPYAHAGAYAGAGVSIGATGGPTLVGDAWTIRPDADQAIRYLAPVGDSTSTQNVRGGQRTSSTEDASAWWALSTSGYVQFRFPGSQNRVHPAMVAVHVEGLNAADPLVRFYDYDAAAYTTMGTMSNTRTGLRFSRSGASSPTVRVDSSGTSSNEPYCRAGSLKGCYFRFSVGGKVRPILDNTEGRWSNDGDAALPILTLGGIDGTEPTSGTAGTIIYHRATFIAAMTQTAEYGAFALQWSSAPDIYEATPRAKVLMVCPVETLLYAGKWGTAYRTEDAAELYESRSGLRRGRQVKNAQRRVLTLPLQTLWDQRPLVNPGAVDRIVYKAYSNGSYPLAGVAGDDFGKLLGAWQRSGGSQHPVLWLPRIQTSATQSLIGDDAGFYCRVVSPPQFTNEYGVDTGATHAHVWRGDNWTLEEET
jgi:hypothetical protein